MFNQLQYFFPSGIETRCVSIVYSVQSLQPLQFLESNNCGDSLLHTALLFPTRKDRTDHVKSLIELGAKTSDTTKLHTGKDRLIYVTPIHIAIGNPKALLCLLKAKDVNEAICMTCEDTEGRKWSPLDLALNKKSKDKNTIMVS